MNRLFIVLAGRPITKKNRGKPARFYAYQFFMAWHDRFIERVVFKSSETILRGRQEGKNAGNKIC